MGNHQSINKKINLYYLFFGVFIAFLIIQRIIFLNMVSANGDPIHYWLSAKTLYFNLPYDFTHHRSIRFSIVLPLYLIQKLISIKPYAYYIAPLAMSALTIFLMYRISLYFKNQWIGIYSIILFVFSFEYILRGDQLFPGIFSAFYILMAVLFILRYHNNTNKEQCYIIISALFLFFAYLAKIPNIFFMPGFIIAIYIKNRNIKYIIIFLSVLFTLYISETIFYYIITGNPLGRIGIVKDSHLGFVPMHIDSFIQLFDRYRSMKLYWKIPFYFYCISSMGLLILTKDKKVHAINAIGFSFFFGATFAISSIKPIVPVMIFKTLYLSVAVPLMVIIITLFINHLYRYLTHKISLLKKINEFIAIGQRKYLLNGSIIVGMMLVLGFCFCFSLINNKNCTDNTITGLYNYNRIINSDYTRGIPILLFHTSDKKEASDFTLSLKLKKGMYLKKNFKNMLKSLEIDKKTAYSILQYRVFSKVYKNYELIQYLFRDDNPMPTLDSYVLFVSDIKTYYYKDKFLVFFHTQDINLEPIINEILLMNKPFHHVTWNKRNFTIFTETIKDIMNKKRSNLN